MELDDDDDDVENGNGDAGDENGLDATSAAATRSIKRAEGLLKSNILGLARKLLMQPSRATRAPAAAAGAAPTAIASSSSQSVAPEEEGGASSDGSEGTILASARRQRARSGSSTPTRGTRGDGGGIGSENDDADKEEEPAPVPRARRSGAAKRRRGQPATVAGVPLAKMIEALAQVIPANPSTRGHFAAPQTDAMELVPALPAETAALSEIKPMSVLAQEHRHAMNLARAQALAVEAAASGLTPSVVSDSLDAQALATPEVAATAVRTVPRTTADFLTHINLSDANRGRVELTAADADLSDLDDDPDVSRSIVTEPAEIEARECIWNQANWDWMAAQAERQKIRDAARVSGMPLRKRQRRGPNSKSADGSERVGWTASDAARTAGDGHNVGDRVLMTAKSRVSTKINPEALREIFGDAESAAAGGPAVTEEAAYDGGEGYGYDEDYYGEEEAAAPYDMYAVGDDDGHEEV
ncbi:hypothetical protein BC828DRAFT_383825 [Blastocladiella britannica]|nr:hypothetical protein BC828DRAFT_383825 [Blastocladiella britannica]